MYRVKNPCAENRFSTWILNPITHNRSDQIYSSLRVNQDETQRTMIENKDKTVNKVKNMSGGPIYLIHRVRRTIWGDLMLFYMGAYPKTGL